MFQIDPEMEKLLATPIRELTGEQMLAASDYRRCKAEYANSIYVPPVRNSPPAGINDSIDAFQSMVDGKLYDSKSQYYADLKASGNRIYEKGEENQRFEQRGDYNLKKELREAVERHWK